MLEPLLDPMSTRGVLISATGWLVKSSVLLLIAWSLTRLLLDHASASLRHAVWAAALVGVVALPALEVVAPWQWTVTSLSDGAAAVRSMSVEDPPREASPERTSEPRRTADAAPPTRLQENLAGNRRQGAQVEGTSSPLSEPVSSLPFADPTEVVLLVWAAGTLVLLAFLLRGQLALLRARWKSREPGDPDLQARAARLADQIGLQDPVSLRETDAVSVPLTTGIVHPMILLPDGARSEWSGDRIETVLLHELAHVRRFDLVSNLAARLVCALQWFNPLAWIAARKITAEGERACDDIVLRSGTRPSTYADHLLEIVTAKGSGAVPAPAVSMARPDGLEARITALLDEDNDRRGLTPGVLAALAVTTLLVSLFLTVPTALAEPPGADREERIAGTLVELLDDSSPEVRAAAAGSLGDRRATGALAELISALQDPVPEVRWHAVKALGRIEDPAAADALASVLADDPVSDVRDAAAWALGETETPRAVEKLSEVLPRVSEPELRKGIVHALGETRRPEAVPVLRQILDREDSRLRPTVLKALVHLDTPEALNVVLDAARSSESHLRLQAAEALGDERRHH